MGKNLMILVPEIYVNKIIRHLGFRNINQNRGYSISPNG